VLAVTSVIRVLAQDKTLLSCLTNSRRRFCTAAYCRPIMTPIKALSWTLKHRLNALPLAYGPHASTLC